jgi:hypothetical protein
MAFVYSIDYKYDGFVNEVSGDVVIGVELLEGERGLLLCRPRVLVS